MSSSCFNLVMCSHHVIFIWHTFQDWQSLGVNMSLGKIKSTWFKSWKSSHLFVEQILKSPVSGAIMCKTWSSIRIKRRTFKYFQGTGTNNTSYASNIIVMLSKWKLCKSSFNNFVPLEDCTFFFFSFFPQRNPQEPCIPPQSTESFGKSNCKQLELIMWEEKKDILKEICIIHRVKKILYIQVVHELSRKPSTAKLWLAVNREKSFTEGGQILFSALICMKSGKWTSNNHWGITWRIKRNPDLIR